jgi:hypothetical protein
MRVSDTDYTCSCLEGYTGQFCELEMDECGSNPCRNNGTCKDLFNDFLCSCIENFDGKQCEEYTFVPTPAPLTNLEWEWIVVLTILSVLVVILLVILVARACIWRERHKE